MKKILLLTLLTLGLFAESNIPLELTPRNINYLYSYGEKKCIKLSVADKNHYLGNQKNGTLLVERNYDTVAGVVSETLSEINGQEYQHLFAETYGSCMLYVDVVINKKEIQDKNIYIKMQDPKLK